MTDFQIPRRPEENHSLSYRNFLVKNSKRSSQNVESSPPPRSSSLRSRSRPLVWRHVGEPQGFSAGFLSAVPSHFHLSDIISCLPATPAESKEVSRRRRNFSESELGRESTESPAPTPCQSGRLKMFSLVQPGSQNQCWVCKVQFPKMFGQPKKHFNIKT